MKILLLEDEAGIRGFVYLALTRAGHTVYEAEAAQDAYDIMAEHPDLQFAVLDVMMTTGSDDGLDVCRNLRAQFPQIGIIILTARSTETDKVTGLITGADDYMTKPFSPSELLARIEAVTRRMGYIARPELTSGPFTLHTLQHTLHKGNNEIKLTQIEYLLLKHFFENPGVSISRDELLEAVWRNDKEQAKTVDVNIRRLRMKLESDPNNPLHIITVWGYGYKWEV